jgi:hypothetical protein
MKVDMSPAAVGRRLEQVEALRKLCLSLACSSVSREIALKHPANERVRRTARALGRA